MIARNFMSTEEAKRWMKHSRGQTARRDAQNQLSPTPRFTFKVERQRNLVSVKAVVRL